MRALIRTVAAAAAVVTVLLAATGGQAVVFPHVYWTNHGALNVPCETTVCTIGRANLDGTGADQSFVTGATKPAGVAVYSNYVYWANAFAGTIGRANLDGTGVEQGFITGASAPAGVAVDAG